MNAKKRIILTMAILIVTTSSSFAAIPINKSQVKDTNGQVIGQSQEPYLTIKNQYKQMLAQVREDEPLKIAGIKYFLDKNMIHFNKKDASISVLEYEKLQIQCLFNLNEKLSNSIYQRELRELGREKIKNPNNIQNSELKELLTKVYQSGYTITRSEGIFYPIIDYQSYQQYRYYVTDDIAEYIDMMEQSQNTPTAADAGIVIGWDELLERAMRIERFINNYPHSDKIKEIKKKYNSYVYFVFYGLDNTPVINRSTKEFSSKIILDYEKVVEKGGNEKIVEKIQDFLELLKEQNYQLTNEVDLYRKNAVNELQISITLNQ